MLKSVLSVIVTLMLTAPMDVSSETIVVQPEPIDDVLYNPGVGVEMWNRTTWANYPESYPEVTLTYYRWYWANIEPERGKIRWDIIDAAFEDAAANGDRLGFRLMTVGGRTKGTYEGKTGQMAVPEWWAEQVGGYWYERSDSDRRIFWPDYNSPGFLEEIERIMAAFSERYGDHPALNHIDTSFFGCWGEQNDACVRPRVDKEKHWWTPETYRKAIDIQMAAFPNTPFMQLGKSDSTIYDYPMKVRKLGWRVDCFGDYGYFGPGWNHMKNSYPAILERYGDAWQSGMVSLEICGTIKSWVDKGFDFNQIMDDALAYHATSMNLKAGNIPEEWMPKLLDTIKYLGYRLRIDRAEFPATISQEDPWDVRVVWVNEGVAPPYHRYPLVLQLTGEGDDPVIHKTYAHSSLDTRALQPGEHAVDVTLDAPGDDVPAGSYTLSIGLLDRHENMPGIQLANEGREGESYFYKLGTVEVVR